MADLKSFRPRAATDEWAQAGAAALEDVRLATYTQKIQTGSLLNFLRLYPEAARTFWADGEGLSFAGSGEALRLTAAGETRFADVGAALPDLASGWQRIGEQPPAEVRPRLLGGFAFVPEPSNDPFWEAFPEALFILPEIQLVAREDGAWLMLHKRLEDDQTLEDIEVQLKAKTEAVAARLSASSVNGVRLPSPSGRDLDLESQSTMTAERWQQMVEDAVQRIGQNEFDKVVLARTLEAKFSGDLVRVLEDLDRRYANCFRFLLAPAPDSAFFGATPELLVRLDGDRFTTIAMAGSIGRGGDAEQDDALASRLLSDPKEREEHAIVVQSIARKLAPWVEAIDPPGAPEVIQLANIQHLQTGISGVVSPGASLLDLVDALHPTPAVGGSPSEPALAWLAGAEPVGRGWYAGPIGWLDFSGGGAFAVAIRSAVQRGRNVRLYAGAGLVTGSIPEKEWKETGLKFKPLLEALSE